MWEDKLPGHQIRGWRAASAAGLQGKGLSERSVFFTDTGIRTVFSPNPSQGPQRCRRATRTSSHRRDVMAFIISGSSPRHWLPQR